ncbi:MAG: pyrroline-5-carboxylate reductase [Candidatus Methanoplasma sp.]|jgi:pyrroline-5-carboxylate reductase|nr:pyrroline-5-carboxylate reductase [Candidatus Methanoplasma sp.]
MASIGFIGAGRMAEAMIKGLIARGVYSKDDVVACAPSEETRKRVSSLGVGMYESAGEVAGLADILVLAVKPKHVQGLFESEGLKLKKSHLLISIAAGITIETLKSYVPDSRIVRVMPNHCCAVLEGAAGFARGNATDDDIELVKRIFSATGLAVEVRERDMDAVTGVSGSSPAFVYMFLRAVVKAGTGAGLTEDVATKLAAQSLVGAGRMALETGMTPEALVDNVCSPGGTTIEGVKVLDAGGFEELVEKAVSASVERSKEMSGR